MPTGHILRFSEFTSLYEKENKDNPLEKLLDLDIDDMTDEEIKKLSAALAKKDGDVDEIDLEDDIKESYLYESTAGIDINKLLQFTQGVIRDEKFMSDFEKMFELQLNEKIIAQVSKILEWLRKKASVVDALLNKVVNKIAEMVKETFSIRESFEDDEMTDDEKLDSLEKDKKDIRKADKLRKKFFIWVSLTALFWLCTVVGGFAAILTVGLGPGLVVMVLSGMLLHFSSKKAGKINKKYDSKYGDPLKFKDLLKRHDRHILEYFEDEINSDKYFDKQLKKA